MKKEQLPQGRKALLQQRTEGKKDTSKDTTVETVQLVPLRDIALEDNTFLLRLEIDDFTLMESIQNEGQKFPIILRGEVPYQIVSGFRRISALRKLLIEHVKAIVCPDLSDDEALKLALIENLQRQSLSNLEIALSCARLRKEGYSTFDISELIGKDVRTIQRYIVIAHAPSQIKEAIHTGVLSMTHALKLLQIHSSNIDAVIDQIASESLSVRDLEQVLKKTMRQKPQRKPFLYRNTKSGFHFSIRYNRHTDDLEEIIFALEQLLADLKSGLLK